MPAFGILGLQSLFMLLLISHVMHTDNITKYYNSIIMQCDMPIKRNYPKHGVDNKQFPINDKNFSTILHFSQTIGKLRHG